MLDGSKITLKDEKGSTATVTIAMYFNRTASSMLSIWQ
jgi:hypothetical protein